MFTAGYRTDSRKGSGVKGTGSTDAAHGHSTAFRGLLWDSEENDVMGTEGGTHLLIWSGNGINKSVGQ